MSREPALHFLSSLHIMVLEDKVLGGIADFLALMGAGKVTTVATLERAMSAISKDDVSLALLDVRWPTETSVAVATALAARSIPLVFTTGGHLFRNCVDRTPSA